MWRKLTPANLASTLNQRELEAYRKAQSDEGNDPVEEILANTAQLVRGYCRAAGAKLPPDALAVPGSLVGAALDYAAFDVCKRFKAQVTEDRRKARTDAAALFELVRKGDFPTDPVDDETEDGSASHATTPATASPNSKRLLD